MNKHFYHSSTKFFTALKPNSPVTEYKEDAIYLAAPWILTSEGSSPRNLPEDSCIYVYRITSDVVARYEEKEGSKLYSWITTDWAKVELVYYYPSWHNFFGVSSKNKNKTLDEELESLTMI